MKRVRQKTGSVVFDKRIRTWNFIWWENGQANEGDRVNTRLPYQGSRMASSRTASSLIGSTRQRRGLSAEDLD